MQFGAKPLFENISVRFGKGNRYGLIGANGCGKSTLMKILGGDLEPTAGSVSIEVAPGPVCIRGIYRYRHGDHGAHAAVGNQAGA